MKEQEKVGKSSGIFTCHCEATEKTWAHQRRKRRENLRKSAAQERTDECQPCSVDKTAKEHEEDTSNDMEIQNTSGNENTGTKTLTPHEASTCSGVFKGVAFDAQEGTSRGNDPQQSETVPRPLVSFMVRVGTGAQVASDLPRDSVVLEMTWVDGQDKNDLYQLYQFFENKLLKGF